LGIENQDRAAIAVHRLKLESLVNELKTEIDRLQNEIRSADQRSAAVCLQHSYVITNSLINFGDLWLVLSDASRVVVRA
jgi:hypothetical protein